MEMFIHQYTRQQALEDGVLFDVSKTAKEAGIKYPVAVTCALQSILTDNLGNGQSYEGRLWDLLNVFIFTARNSVVENMLYFIVSFVMSNGKTEEVKLKAICDGGDDGKPVITIMLANED